MKHREKKKPCHIFFSNPPVHLASHPSIMNQAKNTNSQNTVIIFHNLTIIFCPIPDAAHPDHDYTHFAFKCPSFVV
jgi:hypothetical protein